MSKLISTLTAIVKSVATSSALFSQEDDTLKERVVACDGLFTHIPHWGKELANGSNLTLLAIV